jgi:crotonobetainyl-CoA:carnitine CoA-transferase CaiB-like acyl-CoA transferase
MGIQGYSGYRDGLPSKVGQSYPDFLACWSGLVALMAALVHRDRTGQGQWIDLGMYQLGGVVMPEAFLQMLGQGENLPRVNEDLDAVFSAVVPARGDDRWLTVSAADQPRFEALCAVVGLDPDRVVGPACVDAVRDAVTHWAAARDSIEAARALQAVGVAAAPVYNSRELMSDPHLRERGFYEPCVVGHGVGCRRLLGRPYRWYAATSIIKVRGPAPDLGEANDYVLHDLLGFDSAHAAGLRSRGVIRDEPLAPPQVHPFDLRAMLSTGELRAVDEGFRAVAGCE